MRRGINADGAWKPLHWVGNSRKRLRTLPETVKDIIGAALLDVQFGDTPAAARPLQRDVSGRPEMTTSTRGTRKRKRAAIENSSGNVFMDLGLPNPEERLAKAELARIIAKIVTARGWNQKHAAEVIGIAQPDMSDLMRGNLGRFSEERLQRFLNALDMDVHIQIRPRATRKRRATVTVEWSGAV
jgi:predicted XRE-type DNA-binding protein